MVLQVLAIMVLFSSTGLAKQNRIYFNTIQKEIKTVSSSVINNISTTDISKTPVDYGISGESKSTLPEFLVLSPQRVSFNLVRTGSFHQDDDSSYGYPAYDPANPNKERTLAALSYFPTTFAPAPTSPGVIHGIAQFIPPLPGYFDIDTIWIDLFVRKEWRPRTSELYCMPILYNKIDLNDTNALRQVENRTAMLFDLNDDKSYTTMLEGQVVTISTDSINNRWEKDANGNNTDRYRYLQLFFSPPLHIPQGQSFGLLIFNPEVNVNKDSVIFPAHLEFGIPSRYYTYGYCITRKTGSDEDSVWLPYRYGYFGDVGDPWGPGGEYRIKWPGLAGMPLMQDYNITFFGVYDAPDNVAEESNIPAQFNLEQNAPNPADDNTDIKFSTYNPEFVNLSVYNLTGELVAELINKTLNPGTYSATLNTSTLPQGSYIYTLQAGTTTLSKVLTVVR